MYVRMYMAFPHVYYVYTIYMFMYIAVCDVHVCIQYKLIHATHYTCTCISVYIHVYIHVL